MNADASQPALPLGWFLLLALPALVVCVVVWLFADGADRVEQALAQLPTDDEPVPYQLADEHSCPECDRAREYARQRLHAWFADRACIEWTADTDRELAELLDGGR